VFALSPFYSQIMNGMCLLFAHAIHYPRTPPCKTRKNHSNADRQGEWQHFADSTMLRYLTVGVPLEKCYGYGKEIYAPLGGRILQAEDGFHERTNLHLIRDLWLALKSALTYNPHKTSLQTLLGNNVIMQCDQNVFAMFAHMKTGSVAVSVGEQVERGALLGRVGHSGNSTAPHLHFQLMDSSDLLVAKGIPCLFAAYEIYTDGKWEQRRSAVPSDKDRVRFLG